MVSGRDPDSGSRCDHHLDDGLRKADSAPPCGWASRCPQRTHPNKTPCLPASSSWDAGPSCAQTGVYATCSPGSQALGIGLNCTPLHTGDCPGSPACGWRIVGLLSLCGHMSQFLVMNLSIIYHLTTMSQHLLDHSSIHLLIRLSVLLSLYLSAIYHHLPVILMVCFSGKPPLLYLSSRLC